MRRIRWGDVLVSAVAAAGWSLAAMAGVAALGLHLLGADAAGGSLGAMTAAAVVLAVGGTVTPSGDVSVFGAGLAGGAGGAGAEASLDVMPLGVGLAGALVLAHLFLRSLRAGAPVAELLARAVVVVALFVAAAGVLAWAGHDVVTLDGAALPRTPARIEVPGIGDVGGLLPDRIGDLIETRTRVGFSVEPGPTLRAAGVWAAVVLALALLVSRRGPAAFARLRPAASAVVAMLLAAVAAGLAAAVWAALGEERPGRVLGAALLGAPNGSWAGVLLGLFVPLDGRVGGEPARLLPDPLDELLTGAAREPVTVARLAEYDGRVWLLAAGAGLLLLYAGVLAAVRTPGRGITGCAARLSAATGVALAALVWLTALSADASLAVLGVDVVDAGVELRGSVPLALTLGAVWGAVAGALGALLARHRRAPLPRTGPGAAAGPGWPDPRGARPGAGPGPGPGPAGRPAWPAAGAGDRWPDARRGEGPGAGRGSGAAGGGPGRPDPDAPTASYGQVPPPGRRPDPHQGPDGSWDVTVTGIPPRPPRPPKPPRRPPFTPPPPPGSPPPPKPR
ncbi:streptophobe family protein [Streptomyces sp. IBSNAI002]|uniref:streptophobe family protein n=1 Tax=Streptomyces sp. IBSNAI002 TaxID=3457500 RepID=UPI003FD4C4AC